MPDDSLHQPHDKLFKGTFGDPANAAGFLRWELPHAITAAIDWERLRLEPGSYIDEEYRQTESDLLFSAPIGATECMLYVLFEHQTAPDPDIALRLLGYQLRIWARWRQKTPRRHRVGRVAIPGNHPRAPGNAHPLHPGRRH